MSFNVCFPEVVVQFEHTQYTIVENETTAEVCVVVRDRSCPSAVPFTLSIDTVSDSAGMRTTFIINFF